MVRGQALVWRPLDPPAPARVFSKRAKGSAKQRAMSKVMLRLFDADVLADKDFATSNSRTGESSWRVELTPKRRSVARQIKKIELTGSEFIDEVRIDLQPSGHTFMRFNGQQSLSQIPLAYCSHIEFLCGSQP